eukprot:Sspe_Gene.85190::Locus_55988_Transcript_1_1_Confidence_1.000_Length_651::g.85190::m.85190
MNRMSAGLSWQVLGPPPFDMRKGGKEEVAGGKVSTRQSCVSSCCSVHVQKGKGGRCEGRGKIFIFLGGKGGGGGKGDPSGNTRGDDGLGRGGGGVVDGVIKRCVQGWQRKKGGRGGGGVLLGQVTRRGLPFSSSCPDPAVGRWLESQWSPPTECLGTLEVIVGAAFCLVCDQASPSRSIS